MNTLHHVTYVVRDLGAGVRQLEQLAGAAAVIHETLPGRGVRSVRARVGGVWLVFVEPVGPGAPADYLDQHGEGPFIVSWAVPSLEAAVRDFRERGIDVAGPSRVGLAGWRVQDLVMSLPGGATVQLCEAGES